MFKATKHKLIDFISDDGFDCSISWHYSVNAAEQQMIEALKRSVHSNADRNEYCYSKHEMAGI